MDQFVLQSLILIDVHRTHNLEEEDFDGPCMRMAQSYIEDNSNRFGERFCLQYVGDSHKTSTAQLTEPECTCNGAGCEACKHTGGGLVELLIHLFHPNLLFA